MNRIEATAVAELSSPVEKVWALVTDNENTAWRSDLDRVETDGDRFTEYTKSGFPTAFTVTARDPLRRYAFDLENANMTGRWTGEFSEHQGGTRLRLTESVSVRSRLMRLLARPYLKKQQAQYLRDLRSALGEDGP